MSQQQVTNQVLIQIHAACLQPLKAIDKAGKIADRQRLIEGRMALVRMTRMIDELLESLQQK